LGPYVLLAPIGAGGMGEVWTARDTRLERVVAVKRLRDRASTRFKQEARAIAALKLVRIGHVLALIQQR
jgi:eukaryotic-like serine/threonine-protein kinase